jgi:hypothetical protein
LFAARETESGEAEGDAERLAMLFPGPMAGAAWGVLRIGAFPLAR